MVVYSKRWIYVIGKVMTLGSLGFAFIVSDADKEKKRQTNEG